MVSMYLPTRVHFKERSAKDLFDDVYATVFLIFFIKAYVVGTYLNCINKSSYYHHIIIGFLINVQVQGQHRHQWAPFQIAGLLHAWQISHQISTYFYHEG